MIVYEAPVTYAAGSSNFAVTTADLTGNGVQDIVLADYGGLVDVLLGDGSGGFGSPAVYQAGSAPVSVTTADLTGNGIPDIVVANATGGVTLLFGDGSGGFATNSAYPGGTAPHSVTTADLAGNGVQDIVLADTDGGVVVLMGDGTGDFETSVTYGAGVSPISVITADLNGDGLPDIIAADAGGGVAVLLNNGSGGFDPAVVYSVDPPGDNAPTDLLSDAVTAADLTGDGIIDLLVSEYNGGVSVLPGDGSGGFGAPTFYAAGSYPTAVASADVNGDGKPDAIVADQGGGLTVLPGDGSGGLGTPATYAQGTSFDSVAAADLSGSGLTDLVAASPGEVTVLLAADPVSATSITATASASSPEVPGDVVTFAVALSQGARVNGAPALTLNDGGTAVYDPSASTPTSLVFDYTVVAGQTTPDLRVAGLALDGATFQVTLPDGQPATGTFDPASVPVAPGFDTGLAVTACYGPGTRILTERGEVPIERLVPGDVVVTASGSRRRVVWLGHRATDIARHPRPQDVMPVRVQAHAFGPGRPARDLILSPDHAVHSEAEGDGRGVLIPIRYLLNGASVRQEQASRVTWWHVELDAHDLVLADGLAAESYLDTGNRAAFSNGGGAVQAHPDFARAVWASSACAQLAMSGPVVERVRAGLLARLALLGHAVTADPGLRIHAGEKRLETQVFGDWVCAVVPEDARVLRIVSRTTHPAELNPGSDDWRRLGLAVLGLRLDGVDVSLDDARLGEGWLACEPGLRWTGGDAVLDVVPGSVVELCVAPDLLRYCDAARPETAAAA